jgi:hypothetical protein
LITKAFWFGKPIARGANSLPNYEIVENKPVARELFASNGFASNGPHRERLVTSLQVVDLIHVIDAIRVFQLGSR